MPSRSGTSLANGWSERVNVDCGTSGLTPDRQADSYARRFRYEAIDGRRIGPVPTTERLEQNVSLNRTAPDVGNVSV